MHNVERQGGGAISTQGTYNSASEQKKRGQRIDRQSDHSTDGGYEAPNEPYYGGNHAEDASKNFIIRHRWRAAVMLCGDKIGGERKDNEAAEELGWVNLLERESRASRKTLPRNPEGPCWLLMT